MNKQKYGPGGLKLQEGRFGWAFSDWGTLDSYPNTHLLYPDLGPDYVTLSKFFCLSGPQRLRL